MDNHTDYYVYYYLREQDSQRAKAGTPYYVGKGRCNRIHAKHRIGRPKRRDLRIKIAENLTSYQASQIEVLHIAIWGRVSNNTGILHNLTDGGDGVSGYKWTEEVRHKVAAINSSEHMKLKRQRSQKIAQNNPITNLRRKQTLATTNQTLEVKAKRSDASLRSWQDPQQRLNRMLWRNDPEQRDRWLEHVRSTTQSKEFRESARLKAIEAQNRPEVKLKQAEAKQQPETKKLRSESNAASWSVPETRNTRISSLKAANKTVEVIERRTSAAKDYYKSIESRVTCEVCGKITTKQGYGKGHGSKCRMKKICY